MKTRMVRQFWDAFNRAAWAEFDALVTPDYRHHPPGKTLSLEQFKAGGQWIHITWPTRSPQIYERT